jgi:hypothetical protein
MSLKVNNLLTNTTFTGTDASIELKEGETYTGVVKERLSADEAIIQIRGKDVQVKFEGEIPEGGRIEFRIADNSDGVPLARIVKNPPKAEQAVINQEIGKLLKFLDPTFPQELRQELAKMLLSSGIPVDKKMIEILNQFLVESTSNDQQKFETIAALLNKKLDITLPNLVAVDAALNSKPIALMIRNILTNPTQQSEGPLLLMKSFMEDPIPQESVGNLTQSSKERLVSSENRVNTVGKESSMFFNGTEENGKKISEDVRINGPSTEEHLNHENSLDENGRIRLIKDSVQKNMEEIINIIQNLQKYDENEYLQHLANFPSKEYIVAEVTRKLGEIAENFKQLQKNVVRNIDNLLLSIQQNRGNVSQQIKPLLENTIDLIDKAILKSEITLFTDMKTEKELLQASSQLAEARRLLAKGDQMGARQIVEEVKNIVQKIEFRPVDVKVRHYISKEIFVIEPTSYTEKWNHPIERYLYQQQPMGSSAKSVYEMFRSLGLNYDSEVAQAITFQSGKETLETAQKNVKAELLHLLKNDSQYHLHTLLPKDIERALNHLTGQQLLSKSDTGSALQSMFFSLPLVLGTQVENLNVYINSKKDGNKIDWENCSIYFLIETKKMGETGILLTSADCNLSITLKNDTEGFREKMEPLVRKYKEKLTEIGYHVTGIHFTKLNPEPTVKVPKVENKVIEQVSISNKKGFDFKI